MRITVDELKADVERYLRLAGKEEIIIVKDGRDIAEVLPPDVTREEARLAKHENPL